jgi:putative iron-regulated protein
MNAGLGRIASLFLILELSAQFGSASDAQRTAVRQALRASIVSHYCSLMHAGYADSLRLARELDSAISSFLAKPDAATLHAARKAWIHCRSIYIQTEVGRFYDGPIEAVEGMVNAWPIDENYIDYSADDPAAGIINQPEQFPRITREILRSANESGGEKNISTGFHAIEFLLWGQDSSDTGPGDRPPSDYVNDDAGRARHADRRREYLRLVTALLVEHLAGVEKEWAPDMPGNYRSQLLSLPPDSAIAKIVKGAGSLSGAELGGERLLVPYSTKEQEDEHSCFSDTTHLDLIYNQVGIQNVIRGTLVRADGTQISGPGLSALIEHVDPKLNSKLNTQLEESLAALKAIPVPFDQAVAGRDSDPGRVAIKRAIDAIQEQTTSIAKAAKALGLRLELQ